MRASVMVLAYHRIDEPGSRDLSPDLIDATPTAFELQMRHIAARYNVISSWELVRALREGAPLPSRALVITFDDGYRSFLDTALPIMTRLGLPATLFVPTYFPGNPHALFWWDIVYRALAQSTAPAIDLPGVGSLPLTNAAMRQRAYERLVFAIERLPEKEAAEMVERVSVASGVASNSSRQMLSWEELAALDPKLVALGPHTRNHIVLAQATPERIRAEVAASWTDLSEHIPNPLPIFAYPNGKPHAINAVCGAAVRQVGLAGAFTMIAGINVPGRVDPYFMHRVGMVGGESFRHFTFKLTTVARIYRRLKGMVRSGA